MDGMGSRALPSRAMQTAIRAVTFDADGTLWDFDQAMRAALTSALADIQVLTPPAARARAAALTIADLQRIRNAVAADLAPRGATLVQVRLAAFERTLHELGVPDAALAAHINARFLEHRQQATRLYEDTVPALDTLARAGLTLGIISNGNTDPGRCGIANYFAFALFADQHGPNKPDRRLFDLACEMAVCRPDEVLHIGDSLLADVAGARAVGMQAVWLNRDDAVNTTGIEPHAVLTTLADLPALCR